MGVCFNLCVCKWQRKSGCELLFDVLRRVDLNWSVADIVQSIVDEQNTGKFVIKSVKAASLDAGPHKDLLLNEQCAILADMKYCHVLAFYRKVEEEQNTPEPVNAF